MSYLPDDHIMWDFWFAPRREGEPQHLFYLRAPDDLGDPEERHWIASTGHAASDDLHTWRDLGTALAPSEGPAWDDRAIWTGSIIDVDGTWYWFYTALTHADRAQRVGLATSADLEHWERHPGNPILEADPRWYETAETSVDGHVAFRDPWVVRDPGGDGWLMYLTARASDGPMDGRGVIALARSADLLTWTLEEPVTAPGAFAELEVPQYLQRDGRHYLLFCSAKPSEARLAAGAEHWRGTHFLTAEHATGPWHVAPDPPMAATVAPTWYAGRVLEYEGAWLFFAWPFVDRHGVFLGGLSDPMPVRVDPDGRLAVELPELPERG